MGNFKTVNSAINNIFQIRKILEKLLLFSVLIFEIFKLVIS